MIEFWIAAAIVTAGIVTLLAMPLMRRADAPASTEEADLAVYRDQLAELERDRARGLVDPAQATAMEAEIGRRMLQAANAAPSHAEVAPPARKLTFALMLLIPVAGLGLYLAVGHPDLPGMPLAAREIAPAQDPAQILASAEQLKARLKPVREDLDKWVVVGQVYNRLGRPRDAADAFGIAASIAPEDFTLAAAQASALVVAGGGAVGEDAKRIFRAIPADSPARPEARFYLALADAQAGDMKAAMEGWQALVGDSPPDAPWLEATRARIAAAATALGLDPEKESKIPAAAPSPGPSAADIDAASQMSPEQRSQMIRGMVASLAAKLEANPDDAEGWRRLARAYQVLGEDEKAKDASAKAEAAEKKNAAPR